MPPPCSIDAMDLHISIVPHTHWDREWYSSYQRFRMRLVGVVDSVLDIMEGDPGYAAFLMDGQMAMVDDYLEVRPGNEERIRSLALAGRITLGPWYVLADEFLVSGEALVRNLQLGMERAASFGGAMQIGYLPDMFGHIAQMPQILRLAGFGTAIVWRGVPSSVTTTTFTWESPDGSAVEAEYLLEGYSNGVHLPEDPGVLLGRLRETAVRFHDAIDGHLLVMNGSDHEPPQHHLAATVQEAQALLGDPDERRRWGALGFDHVTLAVESLPAALSRSTATAASGLGRSELPGPRTHRGELRSGARANLLMGVASNHVDVKVAADQTFMELERRAEPYAALYLPDGEWPERLFEIAWKYAIWNEAHDSICACSVDEVVDTVNGRFREATEIAKGISEQSLARLAGNLAISGPTVVNPSARRRSAMVEVLIPASGPAPEGVQVLHETAAIPGPLTFSAETVAHVLPMLQSPKIMDDWVQEITMDLVHSSEHTAPSEHAQPSERTPPSGRTPPYIEVHVTLGPSEKVGLQVDAAKQHLATLIAENPGTVVNVHLDRKPHRRVLALAGDVPGFGWKAFEPAPLESPVAVIEGPGGTVMSNGIVEIIVDPESGTWSVDGISGFGRLVDSGDAGDSYNYSPPPADSLVDTPDAVEVSVVERGPVRATVQIDAMFTWPEALDPSCSKRTGSARVAVVTLLELRAGDRLLRVTTSFVNPARDHRLRVHFPLPSPARCSVAGDAFGQVERGLDAEGRSEEVGLPTFPSRGFVSAGGLTLAHQGLCEYELIEIADSGPRRTTLAPRQEAGRPAAQAKAEGQRMAGAQLQVAMVPDRQLGATEGAARTVGTKVGMTGGQARSLAITLLRATGMLSRLGMRYRPLPAGPLTPVAGLQLLGKEIVARYALSTKYSNPYELAEDAFSELDAVDSEGGGALPASGSALEVRLGTAEISSLRRHAHAVELRVFNPAGSPTTIELPGLPGSIVNLAGSTVAPFDGSCVLSPYEIATIRLDANPVSRRDEGSAD